MARSTQGGRRSRWPGSDDEEIYAEFIGHAAHCRTRIKVIDNARAAPAGFGGRRDDRSDTPLKAL